MSPREEEFRAALRDLEEAKHRLGVVARAVASNLERIERALKDAGDWRNRMDPMDAPRELAAALQKVVPALEAADLLEAAARIRSARNHAEGAVLAAVNEEALS